MDCVESITVTQHRFQAAGVKVGREVSFTKIRQHHDNHLAFIFRATGDLDCRSGGGSATDSAEKSFFGGQIAGHLHAIFILDSDDFIDDVDIQDVRNETGTDSLNCVLARLQILTGLALGNYGAGNRFYSDRNHFRFARFQYFAAAGDGAPGPHARDENIDLTFGITPDFFGSCLAVNFRIGWIAETAGA